MKLEFDKLTKYFGKHVAITIDHLMIPECSTLVMIGPSGGGKSTLLRLIAGLCLPDSGTISINDQPIVFREKELLKHRKHVGVVFQSYNLFPHLTALENIVLPLCHVHGKTKEDAETLSLDLLKRFQLDFHAHKKPYQLSGGQMQRVALIRAVAIYPELLILDEPTSALDPLMTAEVLELILEIKREKRNLILSTHHLNFAKQIADQVLFISEGSVVERGMGSDIFDHPQSEQAKQYMAKVLAF
jgi:polar amino acid transport system ATP-binding protein